MNIVVLGASNKPERYAYQATQLLLDHGYTVIPVHPTLSSVLGLNVNASLEQIAEPVSVITLYVSAKISSTLLDAIVNAKPKTVIFNPGTENPDLETALREQGIRTLNACTLVLLRTQQFDDHVM